MAWTTPKSWSVGELLTAANFNAQIRDNTAYLAAMAKTQVQHTPTADYTRTGATTWAAVDAVNLAGSITIAAGTRIKFTVELVMLNNCTSPDYGAVTIFMDGVNIGDANYGIMSTLSSRLRTGAVYLKTGVAAGAHTFELQFRTSNSGLTTTIYAYSTIVLLAEEC